MTNPSSSIMRQVKRELAEREVAATPQEVRRIGFNSPFTGCCVTRTSIQTIVAKHLAIRECRASRNAVPDPSGLRRVALDFNDCPKVEKVALVRLEVSASRAD